MLQVDNNGKGNCMYYAYSISLMYYLRAASDPMMTEEIFNKLALKNEDKLRLQMLLSKNPILPFSERDIKTVIEPILGKATRDLTAEQTMHEFKSSPHATSLFASAKYGLEFCFKRALQTNESDLEQFIDHLFTNKDYIEAEIYKTPGTDIGMTEYSLLRVPAVIEEFNRQWGLKQQEFSSAQIQPTELEINTLKTKIIDTIMSNETVNYFLDEEEKHLHEYKNHLQKDYTWGSEESLLVLHRAIQGERMVRNHTGIVEPLYDHEIVLHIFEGGVSPFPQAGSPGMILNNTGNAHWTSMIPDSIFSSKLTDKEQKLLELFDEMKRTKPLPSDEEGMPNSDWLSLLNNNLEVLNTNPSRDIREQTIHNTFQLIGKMVPKLGFDPTWRQLLSSFLVTFIDNTPTFLADRKVSLDLKSMNTGMDTKIPAHEELPLQELADKQITKPSESVVLSRFSPHLLFKKSEDSFQKDYPSELNSYIHKSKQSGPKVAKALRQMYEDGLQGIGNYTPELCRDIALRYLSYVTYYKRNFPINEVKEFIQKMDEIIKQNDEGNDWEIEHKTSTSPF